MDTWIMLIIECYQQDMKNDFLNAPTNWSGVAAHTTYKQLYIKFEIQFQFVDTLMQDVELYQVSDTQCIPHTMI